MIANSITPSSLMFLKQQKRIVQDKLLKIELQHVYGLNKIEFTL